jgi:hypothetical protein
MVRTHVLFILKTIKGICGDVDGDGNPSKSSDPNALDQPNMCFTEQFSLMIWPEPPSDWVARQEDFTWFFPQIIVGVSQTACLPNGFGAFEFNGWQSCNWTDATQAVVPDACQSQQNKVTDPSNGGYGADLPTLVTFFLFTLINTPKDQIQIKACSCTSAFPQPK